MDGMVQTTEGPKPGKVLQLLLDLRKATGVLVARKKEKVKFKVRSAEELVDKIREKANKLGLLIYPHEAHGTGYVVEDGTLATCELVVVLQSVEDGSRLGIAGFGLGADGMDKAGGKAGTYAFKQALIQALLAGGADSAKQLGVADTDDTDTPIEGGVKPKTRVRAPSVEEVTDLLEQSNTEAEYQAAIKLVLTMQPKNQLEVRDAIIAAKARCAASQPDRSKDSER